MVEDLAHADVVDLLQEDLRQEHATIVQLQLHAWQFGENEIGCELEELAREDMRHYRWLGTLVAELGGDPTTARGEVFGRAASPADLLGLDLAAKDREIARYRCQLDLVTNPRARLVLARILADEEAHREGIGELLEEAQNEPESEAGPGGSALEPTRARLIELLDQDVNFEYTAILQYLHQSFVVADPALSRALEEDQAQESMKHMGWLAEQVVKLGGFPAVEAGQLDLTREVPAILTMGVRLEAEAARLYGEHLAEIDEPGTRRLLERIQNQEIYHRQELAGLGEARAAESGAPAPGTLSADGEAARTAGWPYLTVGSLFGQPQR